MVGFGDAIRLGLSRSFELGGRSTRAEFWWWWLTFAVITTVLEGTPLALLAGLLLIVPSVTLLVRRLHDTGRSGWSAWVFLIPAVGLLILIAFLVRPGNPASNRYGPPPMHGAGAPARSGLHGGDPGPQGRTGAPPAPDGPRHGPGGEAEDRPRASGWDDLPPPAAPGPR